MLRQRGDAQEVVREHTWENWLALAKGIFHTTGHHAQCIFWGSWPGAASYCSGMGWELASGWWGVVLLWDVIPSSFPLPALIIIILPYSNYLTVLTTTHELSLFTILFPVPVGQSRGMGGFTAWILIAGC